MGRLIALGASACIAWTGVALADCGPEALGTSRTLTLPREAAAYGRLQHAALALQPGEVVLSFDDGPNPASTPQVLKVLKDQCVRASFFMTGEPMLREPALAQRVRAEGHSVGMHGFAHAHAASQSVQAQRADLDAIDAAYRQIFGTAAAAYRFPYLEETPEMLAELKARRVTVMSVDLGIDDWLPAQTPQMLADRLTERLRDSGGGVILLHDAQEQTAAALPLLLDTLKARGYRVVHLAWQEP
jgi:peptidoglycan/xylan/chitin deacetylase (PgdA/CDA1 family)